MQAYLWVDKVTGEVTEQGHKGWIYIHTFSVGCSNPSEGDPSKRGKLVGGGVNYQDVSLAKDVDLTSPLLAKLLSAGSPVKSVKIHVCEDSNSVEPIVEVELTDCLLTSYSLGGGSGGRPGEQLSIAYSKIKVTTTHIDEQGKKGDSNSYTWDLLTKKAV